MHSGKYVERNLDIVRMKKEGHTQKQIAEKYGCTQPNVSNILKKMMYRGDREHKQTAFPGIYH